MTPIVWVGLGVAVSVAFLFLERRRQIRRLRERGEPVPERPGMIGVAALEMQRLLEPERKVEVLQQEARGGEAEDPEQDERGET